MDALEQIQQHIDGQPAQPPLHLWSPELSGDIDIRILSNGDWIHEGGKIERLSLVKLFASILRREEDQEYYLVTPVEKWRVTVEDTPLIIVDMDVLNCAAGDQQIIFTTNTDVKYLLGSDHGLSVATEPNTGEPKPVVDLVNNLTAKLSRSVFYRLVDNAVEKQARLSVLSDKVWFELGSMV